MKNKYDLIINDKNDIDNSLLSNINSHSGYINNEIYRKYIDYSLRDVNIKTFRNINKRKFTNRIAELGTIHNVKFPYNISTSRYQPHYQESYLNDYYSYKKEHARVFRWIEDALTYSFLKKFITFTQSYNGQFSPRTYIDLWSLSTMGSPGKVNYLLNRLFEQSKQFIHLFDNNFSPSFKVMAICINRKFKRVNTTPYRVRLNKKDAMRVAVKTICVYHPFMKESDDYSPIQSLFNNAIKDEIGEHEFYKLRNLDNYRFIQYRIAVTVLQVLIKIKNNDISELALRHI